MRAADKPEITPFQRCEEEFARGGYAAALRYVRTSEDWWREDWRLRALPSRTYTVGKLKMTESEHIEAFGKAWSGKREKVLYFPNGVVVRVEIAVPPVQTELELVQAELELA